MRVEEREYVEPEKVNALLGMNISKDEMISILEKLEIKVQGDNLEIPYFRVDLETETVELD